MNVPADHVIFMQIVSTLLALINVFVRKDSLAMDCPVLVNTIIIYNICQLFLIELGLDHVCRKLAKALQRIY